MEVSAQKRTEEKIQEYATTRNLFNHRRTQRYYRLTILSSQGNANDSQRRNKSGQAEYNN